METPLLYRVDSAAKRDRIGHVSRYCLRIAIVIECSKVYASRNCTNLPAQHLSLLEPKNGG
jgi:hypothetical protein